MTDNYPRIVKATMPERDIPAFLANQQEALRPGEALDISAPEPDRAGNVEVTITMTRIPKPDPTETEAGD